MEYAVRLGDLFAMAAPARARALELLTKVACAPINGQAVVIESRIAAFETRHEMSSVQLVEKLKNDSEFLELAEYAEWLFWLRLRNYRAR